MKNTHLILIDGLTGSGKSSTAQSLCRHLSHLGEPVCWHFENEMNHPIVDYGEMERIIAATEAEQRAFFEGMLRNWSDLVEQLLKTKDIKILESTYFQVTLGGMLLMNTSLSFISSYMDDLEKLLRDLNPVLIRFQHDDVCRALKNCYARRGVAWGDYWVQLLGQTPYGQKHEIKDFQGLVGYYEGLETLNAHYFQRFPGQTLHLDGDEPDWNQTYAEICAFLDVPIMEASFPQIGNSGDYVGTYFDCELKNRLFIQARGKELFMGEDHPSLLIPIGIDTFEVMGMKAEFCFKRSHDGEVEGLECHANLPGLGFYWHKTSSSEGEVAPENSESSQG